MTSTSGTWALMPDLGTATKVVPIDGYPGWFAMLTFRSQSGVIELVDLVIAWGGMDRDLSGRERPWEAGALVTWAAKRTENIAPAASMPDGGAISTRMLRSVNWGVVQAAARAQLTDPVVRKVMPPRWDKETAPRRGLRGPPGFSERSYAEFAAKYYALLDRPKAVERLAAAEKMTVSTARSRVAEARRRGLLTRPRPGRQGGELTPKALHLLEGN